MGRALAPAAEALHKIKYLRYFNLLARNGSRPGREARICVISLCALPQNVHSSYLLQFQTPPMAEITQWCSIWSRVYPTSHSFQYAS